MDCQSSAAMNGNPGILETLLSKTAEGLKDGLVPVEIFRESVVFDAEMERIFARTWVFMGFESEIPKSGDFVLRRIGKDSVIVTRDRGNAINVLAKFCRHRGPQLCQADQGNATHFR